MRVAQSSAASSSSRKTVTQSLSAGSLNSFVSSVPGVIDRFLLEVVAKGKVSEHFEERLVAACMTDIIEIVVLAAGANASSGWLAAFDVGTLFAAKKHVLELVHAGIDEKQGRILGRNQRRTFDDGMAAVFEEFEESSPDFVTVHEVVLFPLEWRPHRIQDEPEPEKDERRRGIGAGHAVSNRSF